MFDITNKQAFKNKTRKRVNFILQMDLLQQMKQLVPNGKRSQFISQAIQQALTDYSRKKAYELMIKTRNTIKLKEGTPEVVELLRKDRYKGGHTSDKMLLFKEDKK